MAIRQKILSLPDIDGVLTRKGKKHRRSSHSEPQSGEKSMNADPRR